MKNVRKKNERKNKRMRKKNDSENSQFHFHISANALCPYQCICQGSTIINMLIHLYQNINEQIKQLQNYIYLSQD